MNEIDTTAESAAGQVIEAFRRAGWMGVGRALLMIWDEDPFWDAISTRLRAARVAVETRLLPREANPLTALEHASAFEPGAGSLVIVHDRVGYGPGYALCSAVRTASSAGRRLAFIEFPSSDSPFAGRLRAIYLRALAFPVVTLARHMASVRQTIRSGPIRLASACGTLELEARAVHDDFSVLEVAPQILQLPLGEVWVLVANASGLACRDASAGGPIEMTATDGALALGGEVLGTVVELGIGTNPAAVPLPTSLFEKTRGRLHLGLGDDALIGGSSERESHFDVLLSSDTSLVGVFRT